nr:hypothetical protein [Nesterenkonia muleiensis]
MIVTEVVAFDLVVVMAEHLQIRSGSLAAGLEGLLVVDLCPPAGVAAPRLNALAIAE